MPRPPSAPRPEVEPAEQSARQHGRPNALPLVRVRGMELSIDAGWLLVSVFTTSLLALRLLPGVFGHWSRGQYWGIAVCITLLGLISLLVHELAHALVARRHGLPVHQVRVTLLGGQDAADDAPRTPRAELLVAVAGPLSSLTLAGVLTPLWLTAQAAGVEQLTAVLAALALFNLLVFGLAMVPVLPLDGGRLLRAVVWHRGGDLLRATRVATRSALPVRLGCYVLGLVVMLRAGTSGGFMLILFGWYLGLLAPRVYLRQLLRSSLGGVRVGTLMERDVPRVPPTTMVRELVVDSAPDGDAWPQAWFVVTYGGDLLGILTRTAVKAIPAEQRESATVYRHMRPLHQVMTVPEETSALAALRFMLGRSVTDIAVTAHGQIVDVLSLASLLRAAQLPGGVPERMRSRAAALQLLDV